MRLKINLASTPYENARRFYSQWGVALIVMVTITALLVVAAARTWRANHALARSIAEERARLDKLNQQEKQDLAILDESQNRDVRQRSQALNALIVRKSFSWTRIFNDLEKMMPTRLHVVSIAPQLSVNNELQIRMEVAGASREKAIELVQNMEKAPDFRDAQIISEVTTATGRTQTQSADAVTFNIVAQYMPSSAPQDSVAQSGKRGEAGSMPEKNQPGSTNEPAVAKNSPSGPKKAAAKGDRR